LSKPSAKRQPSLLERVSGPNAVPLAALVKKGEAAAEKVQESFGDFLDQRIRDLTDARFRLTGAPDAVWDHFYALVVDLRGSAAMVKRQGLGAVCQSLEILLTEHVHDAKAAHVVASHIDALILLSQSREAEMAVKHLTVELAQAVAHVPRKPAD
jgi:hypothetical protein